MKWLWLKAVNKPNSAESTEITEWARTESTDNDESYPSNGANPGIGRLYVNKPNAKTK